MAGLTIEQLYPMVTEAVILAEMLIDAGDLESGATQYLVVSVLEEEIATLLPASTTEGAIARRGAVAAATMAGDSDRAARLTLRYETEDTDA